MASYYVYSGAGGSNNGSSWANAFTTLTTAFVTEVAGDTLYVAHDHTESTAAAISMASSGTISNPTKVICVNRAGSVPPVSADRRTTAQVATPATGGNITFSGFTHYDGIIFLAGTATGGADVRIASGVAAWLRFDNCSFRLVTTSTTSRIQMGTTAGASANYIELNNTTLSFAAVAQGLLIGAWVKWRNTSSALLNTIPTTLFYSTSIFGGGVECIGIDFSAAGSGKTIVGAATSVAMAQSYRFIDCKLNASVTKSTAPLAIGSIEVDFVRSGSTGVNYTVFQSRVPGTLDEETTIVRTGGASDGTTALAWKIITTANCTYSQPFECPPIAIWNDTTGSSVTATVEGIWGSGAVPLDNECFLDVEYLGDASSPLASFVNDGTADLLTTAANQTSSSETWGGSTTAFKLAVTFTPQQKGWVYCRVKVGKASSTVYIDPLVVLS